jgi:nucleotide-binding universal stress UspA family protein
MFPLHVILHPTDFSERSQSAFRLAHALARDHGARLIVLHVGVPPVVVYGESVLPADTEAFSHALEEQLQQIRATDPHVRLEHELVLGSDAVTEILRVAGETPCDLIVMGTHGRTGLRRALLGSVAEQVMRRAPCPVLTVKMPFPLADEAEARVPAEQAAEVSAP